MNNTTYIDMDGVIADFNSWISQFGTFTESDWRYPESAILSPWKVMEQHINQCYLELLPLDLLPKFSNMYSSNNNVKFLTALPPQWYNTSNWDIAKHNKIKWLTKYIENFNINDIIVTKGAGEKILYCNFGDVLYDDRIDTVDKWNAAGGIGIHTVGKSSLCME